MSSTGRLPFRLGCVAVAGLLATPWLPGQVAWRPASRIDAVGGGGGGAMAYDPAREVVVMFGGRDGNTALSNTWIWNGSEWRLAPTTTTPPGRTGQAMAFDWVRGNIVMFGGAGDVQLVDFLGDMWEWDGVDWRQIGGTPLPGSRVDAAMGSDPIRREIVLYGGSGPSFPAGVLGDTWEWDGNRWTQRQPVTQPRISSGYRMAFNPATLRLSMLSRRAATGSVVYEWGGGDWIAISAAGVAPTLLLTSAVTGPAGRGVFALSDSRMWLFDGATWAGLPDSPESVWPHSGAWDAVRQRLVAVGASDNPNRLHTMLFDASQNAWTDRIEERGTPELPSTYDAVRRRIVYGPNWTWTQGGWARMPATQTLGERNGRIAQHPGTGQLVYVSDSTLAAQQTWVYGPSDWRAVPFTTGPAAAAGGKLVADPNGDRLLFWDGGTMWEWKPSTQWVAAGTWSGPAIEALAFDARRDRLVGVSGLDATPPVFETREWDGQTWQLVPTPNVPPPDSQGVGLYAPAFGGVLYVRRGVVPVDGLAVYRYDGPDWTRLSVRGSAPPHGVGELMPASLVYDGGRRRVIASYSSWVPVPGHPFHELVLEELTADREIVQPGAAVTFTPRFPALASLPWMLLLSESNEVGVVVRPGGWLGAEVLPVDPDPLFVASLSIWMGGMLDGQGGGSFALPLPNTPALRGLSFHAAALVLGPGLTAAGVSNGVPVQIAW